MTIIVEFARPFRPKPHVSLWPGVVLMRWGYVSVYVCRGLPLRKPIPKWLLEQERHGRQLNK